jgi:hypothetical protein
MATYLNARETLNVEVSCFANYDTPANPRPVNLLIWLTNAKYKTKVDMIRTTTEKAKRDELKATLPAITPSGTFPYRRGADLIKHSGLIQFDIDLKDNPRIRNYAGLKAQLAKLPFVAYCGLSVSGLGYWGLVPISQPDRHGQHFDALKRVFAYYGITLDDKPRNVASLRGYSFDIEGYFANQVMMFELCDVPAPPKPRNIDYSRFQNENESDLLKRLMRLVETAGEGARHESLLKASRLAGGYVGAGRLDEQTAIYALETVASEWPMFHKSQKTIKDGIRCGINAPIYPEARTYERTTPLPIVAKTIRSLPGKTGKRDECKEANPTRVKIIPDEVLEIDSDDDYPPEWDTPTPQIRAFAGQPVEPFPNAPLAFDTGEQSRRIYEAVIPPEEEKPPVLVSSSRRDEYARILGIAPNDLPLFQLK